MAMTDVQAVAALQQAVLRNLQLKDCASLRLIDRAVSTRTTEHISGIVLLMSSSSTIDQLQQWHQATQQYEQCTSISVHMTGQVSAEVFDLAMQLLSQRKKPVTELHLLAVGSNGNSGAAHADQSPAADQSNTLTLQPLKRILPHLLTLVIDGLSLTCEDLASDLQQLTEAATNAAPGTTAAIVAEATDQQGAEAATAARSPVATLTVGKCPFQWPLKQLTLHPKWISDGLGNKSITQSLSSVYCSVIDQISQAFSSLRVLELWVPRLNTLPHADHSATGGNAGNLVAAVPVAPAAEPALVAPQAVAAALVNLAAADAPEDTLVSAMSLLDIESKLMTFGNQVDAVSAMVHIAFIAKSFKSLEQLTIAEAPDIWKPLGESHVTLVMPAALPATTAIQAAAETQAVQAVLRECYSTFMVASFDQTPSHAAAGAAASNAIAKLDFTLDLKEYASWLLQRTPALKMLHISIIGTGCGMTLQRDVSR